MQHTDERTAEEIAEIERHKYFLSEKAGYDVGWDFAERDWLENYGPSQSKQEHGFFKRFFSRKG